MDHGYLSQTMARMGGEQWASVQSVEKVEEMLNRVILNQEDLWGMLMLHSHEGASVDLETGQTTTELIPPTIARALKAKLENSMDWCQLARSRLKEIQESLGQSPMAPQPALGRSGAGMLSQVARFPTLNRASVRQPKVENSSRLRHAPLSPIHVPIRSPHPVAGTSFPCYSEGRSGSGQSPMNFFVQTPTVAAPTLSGCAGETMTAPSEMFAQADGLNTLLDSDWELSISDSMVPPFALDNQLSARQAINLDAAVPTSEVADTAETGLTHFNMELEAPNGSDFGSFNCRRRLKRAGSQKRDREMSAEDPKPAVIYQRLKPGIDTKKGIPDDGHRGWKKYGNKSIQNANFCRGYYKCSVKECAAKKMVQPTDKDPTIFEVTYVGTHTCSNTVPRKRQQRNNRTATSAHAQVQPSTSPEAAKQLGPDTPDKEKDVHGRSEVEASSQWQLRPGQIVGSDLESLEGPSSESSRGSEDWTFPSEDGEGDSDSYLINNTAAQNFQNDNTVYNFPDSLLWPPDILQDHNLSGHFTTFNVSIGLSALEHSETSMMIPVAP